MTTPLEIRKFIKDWLMLPWTNTSLDPIMDVVLSDYRFSVWPASKVGKHHGYYGGLLKHTAEVLTNLRAMGSAKPELDQFVMAIAGLWHDMGKMEEYVVDAEERTRVLSGVRSRHTPQLMSHITIGLSEWARVHEKMPAWTTPEHRRHIAHCIASHHGKLAWGSPVVPRTMEALLLHQADMQSVMGESGINPEDR